MFGGDLGASREGLRWLPVLDKTTRSPDESFGEDRAMVEGAIEGSGVIDVEWK